MNYTVMGAGRLGGTLGTKLAKLGHNVTFRVPTPDNAKYDELRELGQMVSADQPATPADMTFVATPWEATGDAVKQLGDMTGQLVVDCTNPAAYGATGMTLSIDANTSAAEMIAAWSPGARVVKAFNQVGSPVLEDVAALAPVPMMGVAGDDADGKAKVIALASDLGFDPIDAGGLGNARLLEALALLWMGQAFSSGDPSDFAFGRASKSK